MSRTLRLAALAGLGVLASLWTLAAVGAWWLLQAGATALDVQPAAVTLQAVMSWTERPWVRYWLDPHEADALHDGVAWLLDVGGGPAVWLGSALTFLGVSLILLWAGGLLLGVAALLAACLVMRRALAWWRSGARGPWGLRQGAAAAGEAKPAT